MQQKQRERPRPDDDEEVEHVVPPPEDLAGKLSLKGRSTCPLCREELTALPKLEVCPECQTIHHASCVEEMGRCGTMGCRGLDERGAEISDHSRNLACIAHVMNVAGAALWGPLAVYLLSRSKKDAFAAHNAQQALLLSLAVIPLFFLFPLFFVFSILGAIKGYRGEWYSFPVLGRFASEEAKRRVAAARGEAEGAGQVEKAPAGGKKRVDLEETEPEG